MQTSLPSPLPYPKSWINRLFDWIEELRGPYWLFYVLLGLAMVGLETALKWHDGLYPVGSLFPFHVVFAGAMAVGLWGLDEATRSAREATHALRPMLKLNTAEQIGLEYRLRHIPPKATFWVSVLAGLLGGAFYIWLFVQMPNTKLLQGSVLGITFDVLIFLSYGFWQGAFVYATLHLQSQIGRVYAQYVNVDLLFPQPLYALSAVSTRAAIVTLFVAYLWAFTFPTGPYYTFMLGIILIFGTIGLAILVLPLRGVHLRLLTEKRQRQAELGDRIKSTIAKLYDRADTGNYSDIDGLNKLLSSLELTRQTIDRTSTWPWQPDTPRWLLTAILLPILVWLVQRILSRVGI